MCAQPAPGWQTHEVLDHRLEKVDHFFVLNVFWSIARDVKCTKAGRMLAEFVGPKIIVGLILCDPVFVHVRAQVEGTEWLQEGTYV